MSLPFGAMMELEAHGPDTYVGTGPTYPWEGLYGGQIVAQALRSAELTVKPGHVPALAACLFPARRRRRGAGPLRSRTAKGWPDLRRQASRGPPVDRRDIEHVRLVPGQGRSDDGHPARTAARQLGTRRTPRTSAGARFSNFGSFRAPVRAARAGAAAGGRQVAGAAPPGRRRGPTKLVQLDQVGRDLGEEQAVHAAALAYASDSGPAWIAESLHAAEGSPAAPWRPVSLDHAIWFHRPFRCDRWLLVEASTGSLHDSRGLTQGRVFSQDGPWWPASPKRCSCAVRDRSRPDAADGVAADRAA